METETIEVVTVGAGDTLRKAIVTTKTVSGAPQDAEYLQRMIDVRTAQITELTSQRDDFQNSLNTLNASIINTVNTLNEPPI